MISIEDAHEYLDYDLVDEREKNKEKVTKVKKIYSNMKDDIGRTQAVYGHPNEMSINDYNVRANNYAERMLDFIKTSKVCKTDSNQACFSVNPKTLSGTTSNIMGYQFITSDGTSIGLSYVGAGRTILYIDIDGPQKGSNTFGKDLFQLELSDYLNKGLDINPLKDSHNVDLKTVMNIMITSKKQFSLHYDYLKIFFLF